MRMSELPERHEHRHEATKHLLRLFQYDHLPSHLQEISEPAAYLALNMVDRLPDSPELSTGLRKLLEAKDCFVRAAVLEAGDG